MNQHTCISDGAHFLSQIEKSVEEEEAVGASTHC